MKRCEDGRLRVKRCKPSTNLPCDQGFERAGVVFDAKPGPNIRLSAMSHRAHVVRVAQRVVQPLRKIIRIWLGQQTGFQMGDCLRNTANIACHDWNAESRRLNLSHTQRFDGRRHDDEIRLFQDSRNGWQFTHPDLIIKAKLDCPLLDRLLLWSRSNNRKMNCGPSRTQFRYRLKHHKVAFLLAEHAYLHDQRAALPFDPVSKIRRKFKVTFRIKFFEIHTRINHFDPLRIDAAIGQDF